MHTDTVETAVVKSEATAQIQQLAWIIVLISFLLFCSISIAFSGGVYYFFFRSSIPMAVTLQVGRGTAGIETTDGSSFLPSRSAPSRIQSSTIVSTDSQSQVILSFQIEQNDSQITLGTITLENSSSLQLEEANYPRFDWSNGVYSLTFDNFTGEADVFIPRELDRPIEMHVNTASNATFVIATAGRYTLIANGTSINLVTTRGQADLLSPNRNNNRRAIDGQQVILRIGSGEPVVQDSPTNLIRNGLFTFDISDNMTTAPIGWGCLATSNELPAGAYRVDQWMERRALRLIRTEGIATSQTGCEQSLELDVSGYNFLELRATFAINYQSLQNCGIDGSECPLMFFIGFTDFDGVIREWNQGIFYNQVSNANAPTVCQTCGMRNDHMPISEQVWFTYESTNLLDRFTEEERPRFVNYIRFQARGHQYDVFVSEVALVASNMVIPRIPSTTEETDTED